MSLKTAGDVPIETATTGVRRLAHRLPSRIDAVAVFAAAIGSLLAAGWTLQVWNAHLGIPLGYDGDRLENLAFLKFVIDGGGWIYTNHQVGVPFGLELFDFPLETDNLNYASMWMIGLFTHNAAIVSNIWYALTFPAVSVSAYAVLRWMGVSVGSALVVAIIFADAPMHLVRGLEEPLGNYVSIPLATYLIVSVLQGRSLLRGQLRPFRWRSFLVMRNVWVALLCVIIGSTGLYWAVFAVLILVPSGVASAARSRTLTPLAHAVAIAVMIGGVVLINELPTIVYWREHGSNQLVAHRLPQENEIYALKLTDMVLPVAGHRLAPLANLRNKYDTTTPVQSGAYLSAIGIVGVVGLAWMFLIGLGAIVGVGRGGPTRMRQQQLAFAAIVSFLIATIGGVSALIAYLITPQLRLWYLMSLFIDFFALATVALGLDAIARRWLPGKRAWCAAGLAVVLVLGLIDESGRTEIPDYTAINAAWKSDGNFVKAIERTLPAGSAVFELPYMGFPEVGPVNQMPPYEPFTGYVHSDDLRWSYPTMMGRPSDWGAAATTLPTQTLVDGLVAAGFRGIWVDHAGYVDNGARVDAQLSAITGQTQMVSQDGRFSFFNLSAYARRLRSSTPPRRIAALRRAILHPVVDQWGTGFYAPDPDGSRWASSQASMTVQNNLSRVVTARFYAHVDTFAKGSFTLTITTPAGSILKFKISHRPALVSFTFAVPPGTQPLQFDSNAPTRYKRGDPLALAIHYGAPVLARPGVTPFLR